MAFNPKTDVAEDTTESPDQQIAVTGPKAPPQPGGDTGGLAAIEIEFTANGGAIVTVIKKGGGDGPMGMKPETHAFESTTKVLPFLSPLLGGGAEDEGPDDLAEDADEVAVADAALPPPGPQIPTPPPPMGGPASASGPAGPPRRPF